jgi:hypothetical protein
MNWKYLLRILLRVAVIVVLVYAALALLVVALCSGINVG